ncbi:phage scaffolding protein [Kroppenstedtia sanguinis]|uniref:Phage scaffolding protein n=1 Tax=Kroppenstedtia sanguinis TaxID=1380684 RepID=A0ABW4C469_9BACL
MDLKELLGEELYKQVAEKAGEHKIAVVSDGSYIPKAKFDEKLAEVKEYKNQLQERDAQLKELGAKAKGHDELSAKIEELTAQNEKVKQEYEQKIQQQAFDHALSSALTGAKVKNEKAVRALLDTENIKMKEDKLEGLEDQLKALKESDGYLFESEESKGNPKQPIWSNGQHQKQPETPSAFANALGLKGGNN